MQTLGLSSKPQPTDNIFKRLFWPNIESGYDVDLLGQQGFWVCTAVGGFSGLMLLLAGWPTLAVIYALAFFLEGCGVRERSIVAAVVVFGLYVTNVVSGALMGGFGNPVFTAVILMLLFSNIRATVMAKLWTEAPEDEGKSELPERGRESLPERFANVLPAKLWPVWQYVFYPMAVVVMALLIMGIYVGQRMRMQAKHRAAETSVTIDGAAPTQ